MKVTVKDCQRMIRYWNRQLERLTVNANAVNVNAVNAKEGEKGKEILSPTPPIREKGKGEEIHTHNAGARARFVPPTLEEVAAYCRERHNSVDPAYWWNFYASKGWQIGRNKMVDWKRAIITWECEDRKRTARPPAYADPKAAAFERQREENERRKREIGEFSKRLMDEIIAVQNGGVK